MKIVILVILVIIVIMLICQVYRSNEGYKIACPLTYVPDQFYPALAHSIWKCPMPQDTSVAWMEGPGYAYVYEIDFDQYGYTAVLKKSGSTIGNFTVLSDSEGCEKIMSQSPITGTMTFQQISTDNVYSTPQKVGAPSNVAFVLERNAHILDPITGADSNTTLTLTLPSISPTPLTFIATGLPTCAMLNLSDGC